MKFYGIDYNFLIIWSKYLIRELNGDILKLHLVAKIHPPLLPEHSSPMHQVTFVSESLLYVQISL